MKTVMAVLDKRGENVTGTVIRVLGCLGIEPTESYGVATSKTNTIERNPEALQKHDINSSVLVGYTFSRNLPIDHPQSMKLKDSTLVFEGPIYVPIRKSPAAKVVYKKLMRSDKTIESLFEEIEGDFCFFIAEPQRLIVGRDPIGVQPLYFGENASIAAIATNRKSLWTLGITKTESFPPGHLAFVNLEGFKFKPTKTLTYSRPRPIRMEKAEETLQKLLESSVRTRVFGLKEVAVAFSGGLDSSIIAFLAKKYRVNVQLIHVSLRNHIETEEAKKAADELKLPLQVYLFRKEDVAKVVPRVVTLIEEPDPVKTAIGVPFYWTAEKTAKAGLTVLLAGQGADELFGGYQRYVNVYELYGEEEVRSSMFKDVVNLHENNIERDKKICSFHNVELRLPFASYRIAKFAVSLPVKFKLEKKKDSARKLVLRKVAENLGLPVSITEKPKKAIQYSTGINDALKKIAKEQKMTVNDYVNKLFETN